MKKKILLIATGGTIASRYATDGLAPKITGEELMQYVRPAESFCKVDVLQPFSLDSTNIGPAHWLRLAGLIEENYSKYDGFVICHGTDTMAYTAAALSYLIENNRRPIVITGAQKPIDLEITDARMNLLDSLRVACDDMTCRVSIVFGGAVIAGTRAKKERSKSYNAFSSINYPELARVYDERILHYIQQKLPAYEDVRFYHKLNPRVLLLKLIPGIDAGALTHIADAYDAIIIESFGLGGVPDYGDAGMEGLIASWCDAGKEVIMSTQVAQEGSNMGVYQVGRSIKENYPVLEAYDMTLEATVTKTMWLLGRGLTQAEFAREFGRTVNYDVLLGGR